MPDYPNEFILIGSQCWVPSIVFRDQYARAKSGLTFISSSAWKLLIVARIEEESQAHTQRDRLRVYTRKRLAPKKYGDHIAHDVQVQHNAQLPAGC
jgi:hypothetical protein